MRSVTWMTPAAAVLALVGCVRDPALLPGAGANIVNGRPDVAVDAASGVRLFVRGDTWSADPPDLERVMTPILVTIQNQTGRPIGIRYAGFTMKGASGMTYEAVPPFKIDRPGPPRVAPVEPPLPPSSGFWVSPYLHSRWSALKPWPYDFPYDGTYYDRLYVRWHQPLPTRAMIRSALPEGVLQPGAEVTGFLYFDKLTDREPLATLEARFAPASQAAAAPARRANDIASLSIPLRVVK